MLFWRYRDTYNGSSDKGEYDIGTNQMANTATTTILDSLTEKVATTSPATAAGRKPMAHRVTAATTTVVANTTLAAWATTLVRPTAGNGLLVTMTLASMTLQRRRDY